MKKDASFTTVAAMLINLIAWSSSANAVGTDFSFIERAGGQNESLITDARFHRQIFDGVGAKATFIGTLFDTNGNYLVAPRETWTWIWEQEQSEISRNEITYLGTVNGEDNCWSFGQCNLTVSALTSWITFPCMPERDHTMSLFHNGNRVGSTIFRPTRFRPSFLREPTPQEIHPEVPVGQFGARTGDTTVVSVFIQSDTVFGDTECFVNLPGVTVRFTNNIVGGAGAHDHFTGLDPGTGDYEIITNSAAPDDTKLDPDGVPAGLGADNTVIEGQTVGPSGNTQGGAFATRYHAGVFGVKEKISITARRLADGPDPEVSASPIEKIFDIKVPSLVDLKQQGIAAIFSDGGTCPHEFNAPLNNSNWLTGSTATIVSGIAQDYQTLVGTNLSINDGSLPFGGRFDDGTRSGGCHSSHRLGVDVDINSIDAAGNNIWNDSVVVSGQSMRLSQLLFSKFSARNMSRCIEPGSIHYRDGVC